MEVLPYGPGREKVPFGINVGSMIPMKTRTLISVVAVAGLMTGCASKAQKALPPPAPATTTSTSLAPSGTTSGTTVAATTSTSAPTTTALTTTTVPSGPSACTSSQLAVSLDQPGAGLGHVGVTILFRNTGTVSCVLEGYPGVALLDQAGRQAAQATRTPTGYLGGLLDNTSTPPILTVAPGATASALLESTDVPTGNATSCPSYQSFLVTPPNLRVSVTLRLPSHGADALSALPGCSPPQIHPVVAGSTGRQGP
jgi:hypothetical protein